MKHTPAPWNIHRNIGKKGELGIIANEAPCIICTMGNAEAWPAEAEANAALIVAAPDLLEALTRALSFIEGKLINEGQIIRHAREAIQKATAVAE